VGERAAAVPSKEDVWRLWGGLPKLPGKGEKKGTIQFDDTFSPDCDPGRKFGPREREQDLKNVVLDMYANMRGWSVFSDMDENDEGFDWHPLFMRHLVIRLLKEKRDKKRRRGEESREV
jgi:hypothetical protein